MKCRWPPAQSFSSREGDIGIVKLPKNGEPNPLLKCPSDDFVTKKFLPAVDCATVTSLHDDVDVSVPVTLPWFKFLIDADQMVIWNHIEAHKSAAKLVAPTPNSLMAHLKRDDLFVKITFCGASAFDSPPKEDSSYNSIKDLTQQHQQIDVGCLTPQIQEKVIPCSGKKTGHPHKWFLAELSVNGAAVVGTWQKGAFSSVAAMEAPVCSAFFSLAAAMLTTFA